MSNTYYTPTGTPGFHADLSSADMRAEFKAIEDAFDRLPDPSGKAGRVVVVNPSGTGLETAADDFLRKKDVSKGANLTGTGTLTPPADGHYFLQAVASAVTAISSASSWDGRVIRVAFLAGSTLKHSAALLLPDGQDITCEANDIGEFVQKSAGVWQLTSYSRDTFLDRNALTLKPATANFALEIGSAVGGYSLIDFHSSTAAYNDHDARILVASGAYSGNGNGKMFIQCDELTLPANTNIGANNVDAFPTGTRLVFAQAAAPPGWSVVGGLTNRTLVVGTGGALGGVATHNIVTGCTVVASHTHVTDPATLTATTSSAGAHTHTYTDSGVPGAASGVGDGTSGTNANRVTGSAGAHTHTVSVNIPATTSKANAGADVWQPITVGTIICQKN